MAYPGNAITNIHSGPRIACVSIDGNGQAAYIYGPDADLFTITDNGTGDWTLTLVNSLQTIAYCFAPLSMTADRVFHYQAAPTVSVVRILAKTNATSPAAADADLQIMMLLNQSPAQYVVER